MFILSREKLEGLFGGLAGGFATTPAAVIIFVAVVLLLFAFLVASYAIIARRERRRRAEELERKNQALFARLKLSPAEVDLVGALAGFLKDPAKAYLVLSSQGTFGACLQQLRESEPVPVETLKSLQEKTGLDPRRIARRPRSSRDLWDGMPVVVESIGGTRAPGVVETQNHTGFGVRLTASPPELGAGSSVKVYCHDPRGIYAVSTSVLSAREGLVHMAHSDTLRAAQRRRYFRRRMMTEIFLGSEAQEYKPVRAILLDLGAGGASVRTPDGRYGKGDDVRLFFQHSKQGRFPIDGTVVRTSKHDSVLHIRFGHVTDAVRDRIVKIVNKGS